MGHLQLGGVTVVSPTFSNTRYSTNWGSMCHSWSEVNLKIEIDPIVINNLRYIT